MLPDPQPKPETCNCLALRQAARLVTQLYDQRLAPAGLRTTQFSILAKLSRLGPLTINELAAALVVDRTTLGRNVLPLERDGLIRIVQSAADARSKELQLTRKGEDRLRPARKLWAQAQKDFDGMFGRERAAGLREVLGAVVASSLGASPPAETD